MKALRYLWLLAGAPAVFFAIVLGYQVVTGQPIGANTLILTDAASGVAPAVRASGRDTNISVNVVPKGSGCLQVNGVCIGTGAQTFTAVTIDPGPLTLNGEFLIEPGTSGVTERSGAAVLANSSTNATTTLVATEQDLFNFPVPANTLSANNQFLVLTFRIRNAATANTKQQRFYFGATMIGDSTAVASNNDWRQGDCIIWRTGAATQKAICQASNMANGISWSTGAGGGANISTPAETLSGAVTLRVTGTDGVAAGGTNLEAVNLLWYPAGQ